MLRIAKRAGRIRRGWIERKSRARGNKGRSTHTVERGWWVVWPCLEICQPLSSPWYLEFYKDPSATSCPSTQCIPTKVPLSVQEYPHGLFVSALSGICDEIGKRFMEWSGWVVRVTVVED